jgi:hypothetical protein
MGEWFLFGSDSTMVAQARSAWNHVGTVFAPKGHENRSRGLPWSLYALESFSLNSAPAVCYAVWSARS